MSYAPPLRPRLSKFKGRTVAEIEVEVKWKESELDEKFHCKLKFTKAFQWDTNI